MTAVNEIPRQKSLSYARKKCLKETKVFVPVTISSIASVTYVLDRDRVSFSLHNAYYFIIPIVLLINSVLAFIGHAKTREKIVKIQFSRFAKMEKSSGTVRKSLGYTFSSFYVVRFLHLILNTKL